MSSTLDLVPINAAPLPEGSQPSGIDHISANPGTDLWRKPPSHEISNAPCWVKNFPAKDFRKARVTVSGKWARQYDQGGLVLFLPSSSFPVPMDQPAWPWPQRWVKAGIEYYEGKPHVSVVAAREAADWSLQPAATTQRGAVTFEIEREEIDQTKGTGSSLWVYVVENEKRTAIREVTWVFDATASMTGLISVGIFAARPTKTGESDTEQLIVDFQNLSV